MTNHVHYVAVPEKENSIAKVFHWAHGRYDEYFNKKYALTGNLWEGRPHSAVLDEGHTFSAVRYVERNPVRAGMVAEASDYKSSSARIRCGLAYDSMLDQSWPPSGMIPAWKTWLADASDKRSEDLIRRSTSTGRPCGDESFVSRVEGITLRSLALRKRGRKQKVTTATDQDSLLDFERE